MKRILLIIFFSLPIVGFSQSPQKELEQASHFYKSGNYNGAVELYETAVREGYHGASLFYNLGNAYYRTGKFGRAILWYEKANQLAPADEDIVHNLVISNSKIVDKVDVVPKFFLFNWWEALQNVFHPKGWRIFIFFIYLFLIFSIGIFLTAKKTAQTKYSFFSGVAIFVLFVLSVVLYQTKQHQDEFYQYGIVLDQVVNVKSSPDAKSADAFILHEGIKVKVEDKLEGWNKIRLTDGKIGWIESRTLGII